MAGTGRVADIDSLRFAVRLRPSIYLLIYDSLDKDKLLSLHLGTNFF